MVGSLILAMLALMLFYVAWKTLVFAVKVTLRIALIVFVLLFLCLSFAVIAVVLV